MVLGVNPLVPRVWPHGTLASAGRLGLLHDRIIRATIAVSIGCFPFMHVEGDLLKSHNSLAYQR